MTIARPIPLDELRLLVVVDNQTDTLSSVDDGVPQVPEGTLLAMRLPTVREYQGQPCKTGGYHLSGKAMEARIAATVRDLEDRIRPRVVAPGHCTGWRARAALTAVFAPGRYGPSVVGSLYHLKPPTA